MGVTLVWVALAVIAAKWAADLGYGQGRQAIWFTAGLLCPPLALLILYSRSAQHAPAARPAVG